MKGKFNVSLLVFLCYVGIRTQITSSFVLDKILEENETAENLLEFYIPTIKSDNDVCRNHSLYYLQELKNYTLWATEMFDATTKFPSGILYGSSYDFGNFDECLELKIPYETNGFSGKYCMAKFAIEPFQERHGMKKDKHDYNFKNFKQYYNISMWKMVGDYLLDPSKNPRNEFRISYCMPSSCSGDDLQFNLKELVAKINGKTNFNINVEVDRITCQVSEKVPLETGDIVLILIATFFVLTVFLASMYHVIARRDDYAHIRLSGKPHQIILCFSFPRNFKRLTAVGSNSKGLNCLAGMKLYSMFLIILLHRDMVDYGSALMNPKQVEQIYSKFELTFLLNGPILVDTFFTISGFLATYLILLKIYELKNGMFFLLLYFHRYIRMTSTYCIILAFYCTLFVKLGTGPLWQERIGFEREKCRKIWWANMLYINNYVDTKNYCMFQSWYMACDMNGFIFVPIICWIISKKSKVGLFTMIIAIVVSILTVFIVVFLNDEQPMLIIYSKQLLFPNTLSTFLTVYIPGHMRVSAYFVGILGGYLKYKMEANDYKIPKQWVHGCWVLCVPLMFLALHVSFAFYVAKMPAWFSALYASLHHFTWSVCVAWMVIAISSGHGPWVNSILSWKPVVILSRLTYTVYLCHGAIQLYGAGTIRTPIYASNFDLVHKVAADITLGFLLAFILTMVFESPITEIEKVILWGGKKKKPAGKDEMASATELSSTNVVA